MFENLKIKNHQKKLLKNKDNINALVKEAENLLIISEVPEVKEKLQMAKDSIEYMKLSDKDKVKSYEKKIHNLLGDLKIVLNKKEKAINVCEEIIKVTKQRDNIA